MIVIEVITLKSLLCLEPLSPLHIGLSPSGHKHTHQLHSQATVVTWIRPPAPLSGHHMDEMRPRVCVDMAIAWSWWACLWPKSENGAG